MCKTVSNSAIAISDESEMINILLLLRRIPFNEVPCEDSESVEFLDKVYRYKVGIACLTLICVTVVYLS